MSDTARQIGAFRPIVFDIKPEEWPTLAAEIAEMFRFKPVVEDEADAKAHVPLFRAIKQTRP